MDSTKECPKCSNRIGIMCAKCYECGYDYFSDFDKKTIMNEKYITLEQDLDKIDNSISYIKSAIQIEAMQQYGRYAYAYDRFYNGGKTTRHQVRKTMRNLIRLTITAKNKINFDAQSDVDVIKRLTFQLIEISNLQYLLR